MNEYLRGHQLFPSRITTPARPDLGIVVVIPCYDEPTIEPLLDCLWRCARPACAVEVIVVVNATRADAPPAHARNLRVLFSARRWIGARIAAGKDDRLRFHMLHFPELPPRHAGVGLARRIGMDEAVARFAAIRNPEGIIACLDADCCCDPNYLIALDTHFRAHPKTPGCSIYFEHPLDWAGPDPSSPSDVSEPGVLSPGGRTVSAFEPPENSTPATRAAIRAAIAGYELHLRYYVQGLRRAGSPYAFHTVGSCMAVRTRVYEKQGGMNRRKAGEDFYFLQKIIALGGFTELRHTRVLPSPRISRRAPFGTGQAIAASLGEKDAPYTYAPQVFRDLRGVLSWMEAFHHGEESGARPEAAGLPGYVSAFLDAQGFWDRIAEIRRNAASPQSFRKRFHRWFNALSTLKFIHFATAHRYPKVPVERAARVFLEWSGKRVGAKREGAGRHLHGREALLRQYRRMDRGEDEREIHRPE